MDQDFFRDIEASTLSVDDILREFYAQEETAEPPRPARRESRPASGPRQAPPAERPPVRETEDPRPSPTKDRAPSAETENPMEYESEKEHSGAAEGPGDRELFDLLGGLFRRDGDSDGEIRPSGGDADSAPAETEVPEPPTPRDPSSGGPSLEEILREYGIGAAEEPESEPSSAQPEEPQFFMPKKPEPREEDRASAAEYAAFAAGGALSRGEKSGSVSSMADEALRYMSSLSAEDLDRLASEPVRKPVSSRKDVGAENFNLSGRQDKMVFGDRELDLSPDDDYVPPAQNAEPIYHWTAGEEGLAEAPVEKPNLLQRIKSFGGGLRRDSRRPLRMPEKTGAEEAADESGEDAPSEAADVQAEADAASEDTRIFDIHERGASNGAAAKRPAPGDDAFNISFDDNDSPAADYAPVGDYAPEEYAGEDSPAEEAEMPAEPTGDAEEEPAALDGAAGKAPGKRRKRKEPPPLEGEVPLDENGEFPSFTQYVAGLITGTLFRLRGAPGEPGSLTMDTDGEELGPELTPLDASHYYGSFVPSLRLRFRIGLVLLAILAWISLGLPVSGMLRTARVAAGMCLALQLTVMLLSLDVIANAAVNLVRLRFGADSLAVLCCVLTSFDALAVALDAFGSPHMPLCLLSSLSLMGVLYSSCVSARGLRKALRVPSIAKHSSSVSGEMAAKGKGLTLLKTERPITGFVRRMEEAAPDETVFLRVSPALLLLCLLLAAIVAGARHAGGDFLYIFTALLTPAVPIASLLCFALPFFVGSNRIFYSGAAVAGWSGLRDVGRSQNLIITDRDLFPEGSVEIDKIRIFADAEPERILSYAGTMILASGSGLAPCFAELMNRNGGTIRHADHFELLPGGGMKAIIDGSTILCGGTELMRLMNVRVPFRLVDSTTVLLAVDGVLYGIFNMKYTGQPQVRRALQGLIRSSRHPVFAIRDFNVNPEMLHEIFDIATDGYDFPPYLERFKISEPPEGSEAPVAAVICKEGLGSLSQMADTGRGMYLATRFNLIVTLIAAVVGVFAVFIRFMNLGSVGIGFLLLFAIVWALPVAAASLALKF